MRTGTLASGFRRWPRRADHRHLILGDLKRNSSIPAVVEEIVDFLLQPLIGLRSRLGLQSGADGVANGEADDFGFREARAGIEASAVDPLFDGHLIDRFDGEGHAWMLRQDAEADQVARP